MPKYLKVVDEQAPIVQNYFALVFVRGDRVKQSVSRARWVWLCTIEVVFGKELLESLVTTAANSGCPEDPDPNREYGEPNQLNLHIPSGAVHQSVPWSNSSTALLQVLSAVPLLATSGRAVREQGGSNY